MHITNEKLYEMIVEMQSQQAQFKSEMTEFRADIKADIKAEIKSEIRAEIAGVKAAQSELRADISKWGVVLFIGSMVTMTSIIGVFLTSVVLTVT